MTFGGGLIAVTAPVRSESLAEDSDAKNYKAGINQSPFQETLIGRK